MTVTPSLAERLNTEPAHFNNLTIIQRQPEKLQGSFLSMHIVDIAWDYQRPASIPSGMAQQQALDVLNQMNIGSSWYAMDYIFTHESGWQPNAVNKFGCIGLGQSCPVGSGLREECPDWQINVNCQVKHFTKYANNRYGNWQKAYQYWLAHHNW